jgi:L-ascorbate metabolism protein UlaG (beta-lactamase superfamily)
MSNEKLYLRQNVLVEPLFNQWYAWSYVIAPATAAMCVANLHTKIMQSFIAAPQLHMNAVKNPAMLGGPFMNYDASRVDHVRGLLERTLREQAHLIEFAEAAKQLDEILVNEATGFSLEPLYPKVPEPLKGYVELVYDLNNRATARFMEGLLYGSKYYNRSAQSIALSLVTQDDRPFVLSTPRLEDETQFHLQIPFDHPGIDELAKMKDTPQSFGYIKDVLGFEDRFDTLFASFLTPEAPRKTSRYDGDGIRVRYLGHACVLIETKEVSVLTDPFISYEYETDLARYTLADLPETIDYVLITHAHSDHTALETLLQLRPRIRNVIVPKNGAGALQDPSLKLILRKVGFDNVYEIDEMERIEVPGGAIIGLPFLGEHGDLNIRTKAAYLVSLKGKSILCVADSNNIEPKLYEHAHSMVGDVDVLFIGMECEGAPMSWLYGPLVTRPMARRMDQSRRLDGSNCEKGMDLLQRMRAQQVYVYAMGQEPWLNHVMAIAYTGESPQIVESNKLIQECRNRGIVSERPFCQKEMFL